MKTLTQTFKKILKHYDADCMGFLTDASCDCGRDEDVKNLIQAVREYNKEVVGEVIPVDCGWTKNKDGMPNGADPCEKCQVIMKQQAVREQIRQRQEELL